MDAERWWPPFVDVAALVWLALFAVDVAATYGSVTLDPTTRTAVRGGLRALLLVFVVDLVLCYRWSDEDPRTFLGSNWFLVLTVTPWFRPLRLLRAGRGVRALRVLARSRRVGSFLNKVRRTGRRAWRRLR